MSKAVKSSKLASKNKGSIRLIGGQWGSRKLEVADLNGLRPTTDRVRETVFNWLNPYVHSSRCLDICAGSGALGFEALSRGAEYVDFVELNALAANAIKQSINMLEANACVHQCSAQDFLNRKVVKPYDIVFVDPPFDLNLHQIILNGLLEEGVLDEDALVYCEKPAKEILHLKGWQWHKLKKAKSVEFGLLLKSGES